MTLLSYVLAGERFDIRTAIVHVAFGCRVYAYMYKKNGIADITITSQPRVYLGRPWPQYDRASRPSLLPVIWDPNLADWRFGEYFKSDSVFLHHGVASVFPLRTRARQAESTLELEQFVDLFK